MKKFEEKTISSKSIFTGSLISLQEDVVELPNKKTSKREIVRHPGAVAVIPITKNKKILFVKQYRKPLDRSLVELPAGKMEPGEKPEITAVRELEEETGYTTHHLNYVTSFYTTPGFTDELIYIYLTDQLEKLDEVVPGDDDEFIEVVELTLDEAEEYVKNKRIYDAKTNYAILYLRTLGI